MWKFPTEEQFKTLQNGKETFPPTLELIITPECNQKCSYCYLVQHKDDLYPKETRKPENIIKNLNILLNWYLENKFSFARVDLFSGEIWGSKLGYDVLSTILDYVRRGLKIDSIVIPSNMSFLLDDKATAVVEYFLDQYFIEGVDFHFSASVDGAVIENDTRLFRNEKLQALKNEDFYEKLGKFCKKYACGFHPMVAADSIEKWPENYKWWHNWYMERFGEEFNISALNWLNRFMFLEVRNPDWTDEKIESYLHWIKFMHEYDINNIFKINDKDSQLTPLDYFFLWYKPVYKSKDDSYVYPRLNANYHPLDVHTKGSVTDSSSCGITLNHIVRLGDLAIGPCHRTCYDKFIYGYYVPQEDGSLKIEARNPILAQKILCQSHYTNPVCNNCPIKHFCMKGCFGAQVEHTGELFYPIECVCELFIAKFILIYNLVHRFIEQYNLQDQIECINEEYHEAYNTIINGEVGKKWLAKISQIL